MQTWWVVSAVPRSPLFAILLLEGLCESEGNVLSVLILSFSPLQVMKWAGPGNEAKQGQLVDCMRNIRL